MSDVKHRIRVWLYHNALTTNPNDYTARTEAERSIDLRGIAESAAGRGGANISADAIFYASSLVLNEMGYLLSDGFSVNVGYFTANAHITGVFNGPNDKFDPARHKISFLFNQGVLLRNEIPNISLEILGASNTGIHISQVIDIKTGAINSTLTPKHNLRVLGSRLRIDGTNPEVGVYLTEGTSGTVYKIDPTDIIVNNPSEVMILMPALPDGDYQLKMVSQYLKGNRFLNEPYSSTFNRILSVNTQAPVGP